MINNMKDIGKDLGKIHDDMAHHTPTENSHLLAGMGEMAGGKALHELNSAMKAMGVSSPTLDKIEKNLDHKGMQDLLDAHLNVGDMADLYKLNKDVDV